MCTERNIPIETGIGATKKMAELINKYDEEQRNDSPSSINPGGSAASVNANVSIDRPPKRK
jgi:hypothetical protein